MNTWIEQNQVCYSSGNGQGEWAIPVSALEELKSKSGEQLAREMAEKVYPHHYLDRDNPRRDLDDLAKTEHKRKKFIRGFMEAYIIQQVKIEALMAEVERLNAENYRYKNPLNPQQ
jgi:hypothetical protein